MVLQIEVEELRIPGPADRVLQKGLFAMSGYLNVAHTSLLSACIGRVACLGEESTTDKFPGCDDGYSLSDMEGFQRRTAIDSLR